MPNSKSIPKSKQSTRPAAGAWSKIKRLLLAAWLLGASLAAPADADAGAALHLNRIEAVTVAGGSFATPGPKPDIDVSAARWSSVALPYVIPRDVVPAGQAEIVTTWFRVPAGALPRTAQAPHLYVPRWQTIGKIAIYADGRLIERSRGGAVWNGYNHPLWIPLADENGKLPSEILIRMDRLRTAGGALSTIWLGERHALSTDRQLREWFQAGIPELVSAAFLVVGLFSLGVWARRRRESIYLLFFASSLMSYLRCLHYYVGLEPLPIPEEWFGWITINSAGWLITATYFFAIRIHGQRYRRLENSLLALMLSALVLTMPVSHLVPDIAVLAPLAYLVLFGVVLVFSIAMCVAAWRSRSKEGSLVSAWTLLNIPVIVHDWMLQNYRIDIEGIYLMPYTAIGFFFIFMGLMLARYLRALAEMERANANLESRLKERETQLNESHEMLRLAEREQVLNGERQRLIRDMHDGFGSALISALMVVEHGKPDTIDVAQVLRECIDDLKLTIDSLEPMDTDLLPLLASLRFRLGSRLESAGIALHWEVDDNLELAWLTPGSALQILRILQEVFTNAVKHAAASEIRMRAGSEESGILISIEDNGKGFAPQSAAAGRGLANLKYRAEALSGRASWSSQPGRTRFELFLPLKSATTQEEIL
jgi:signal transduction histidine kinase